MDNTVVNTIAKNSNNHIFRQCWHDIRNLKRLDKERIDAIRCMTDDEKMEIIYSFNEILDVYNEIINTQL